jgi:hypothetical protein
MRRSGDLVLAMVLSLAFLLAAAPAGASAFFGWQVADVASWDVLNVRDTPSSQAGILAGYPNGTPLSLTGKCTGGIDLNNINGLPAYTQRQAVRYRWCEIWVDPLGNGQFRAGWVYGRYIAPL